MTELIVFEFEMEPDPQVKVKEEKSRSGKIRTSLDQLPLADPPASIKIPGSILEDFSKAAIIYSATSDVRRYWRNLGKPVDFKTHAYPTGDDNDPTPFYRIWRTK